MEGTTCTECPSTVEGEGTTDREGGHARVEGEGTACREGVGPSTVKGEGYLSCCLNHNVVRLYDMHGVSIHG